METGLGLGEEVRDALGAHEDARLRLVPGAVLCPSVTAEVGQGLSEAPGSVVL